MDSCRNRIFLSLITCVLPIVATVLFAACARPPSATVGEGADPFQIDKDVAFRTTYYFRVFDYCVARKLKNDKFNEVVVPLTDSLYRFRMSGKANTLISDVKFESGTLKAWEVDPFGAKVEYDPESRRVRVISPHEVATDARRAAIIRDVRKMLKLRDELNALPKKGESSPPTIDGGVLGALDNGLKSKIEQLTRLSSGPYVDNFDPSASTPLSDEQRSALLKDELTKVLAAAFPKVSVEDIRAIVDAGFGVGSSTFDAFDPGRPGFVERATVLTISKAVPNAKLLKDFQSQNKQSPLAKYKNSDGAADTGKIDDLIKTLSARLTQSEQYLRARFAQGDQLPAIQCPKDAPVRRGFQVLGPEGWRTFDQDERLLLAMSASAQPLISTLKDLSNRILNARDNPSAELLPIVLEQKLLSEAGRDFDAQRNNPEVTPENLAKSICEKLVEGTEQKRKICNGQ